MIGAANRPFPQVVDFISASDNEWSVHLPISEVNVIHSRSTTKAGCCARSVYSRSPLQSRAESAGTRPIVEGEQCSSCPCS